MIRNLQKIHVTPRTPSPAATTCSVANSASTAAPANPARAIRRLTQPAFRTGLSAARNIPKPTPNLVDEAELLRQAAHFEAELKLPPLALNQLPGFLTRFQKKCGIENGYFSKVQTAMRKSDHTQSLLSEARFQQFRSVVDKVVSGKMNPHLGILYLVKITEEQFHERCRFFDLTVAPVLPRELDPEDFRRIRAHLTKLGLIDRDISLSRIDYYPSTKPETKTRYAQRRRFLANFEPLLNAHQILNGDAAPVLYPSEVFFDALTRDEDAMNMGIYSRLNTHEESIDNISKRDCWGFALWPFPLKLVHFIAPENVVHSDSEAKKDSFTSIGDAYLAGPGHDGFHESVLNRAGRDVRGIIGWALSTAKRCSTRLSYAFGAFSDAIQNCAQESRDDLQAFLGGAFFTIVGDYFTSPNVFHERWFARKILPLAFHPAIDASHFESAAPILLLLSPLLTEDSPHREFALGILRRKEVVEHLKRYGFANFSGEFRDLGEFKKLLQNSRPDLEENEP